MFYFVEGIIQRVVKKKREKERRINKNVFLKLAYVGFYSICIEESTQKKVSPVLKNTKIDIYSMIPLGVTTHTRESY